MLNVYISTNGCPGARVTSAHLEEFFRMNNCTIVRDSAQSDLVAFYACGLTDASENDSLEVIKKLKSTMKPTARLIVWGCLGKINPRTLAKIYDGPVVGPKDLSFFECLLEKTELPMGEISANTLLPSETAGLDSRDYPIERLKRLVNGTCSIPLWHKKYRNVGLNTRRSEVYWIHTSTGCALNCTYCAEKLAFGRIQSKPIERIVSEFKRGLQEGYGRFCLLSWDLGAYGIDVGCTLSDLLTKLINTDDKRNYKLLLTQINPFYLKQMYSDLEEVFSSGKIEELGCQVESGSNRILGLMGRMYTAEEWMRYMLKIRNKFPKIFLTTHLMVGFPSETNEDFKATMKLLDRIFLDDVIIFKFSKRQQTPASCFPGQIPEKVKESRYRRLALKATLSTTIKKIQRLTNLG